MREEKKNTRTYFIERSFQATEAVFVKKKSTEIIIDTKKSNFFKKNDLTVRRCKNEAKDSNWQNVIEFMCVAVHVLVSVLKAAESNFSSKLTSSTMEM